MMNKKPLWLLFRDISHGQRDVLAVAVKLAKTAQAIDPSCPYGAHGVLGSIADYNFTQKEIYKFFKLCNNDPYVINAIDYAVFRDKVTVDSLRSALRDNFRKLNTNAIIQFAKKDNTSFGLYYKGPK